MQTVARNGWVGASG